MKNQNAARIAALLASAARFDVYAEDEDLAAVKAIQAGEPERASHHESKRLGYLHEAKRIRAKVAALAV